MKPDVHVIVVARGLWEMTQKSLEGLIFTADRNWSLTFMSNGSEDKTVESFEAIAPTWSWQYFCGYKFIAMKRHEALSAAWNRCFRYGEREAEYTIFANNDIYYHKAGWMSRLIETLEAGADLTGIQHMSWYKFAFLEGSLLAGRTETFRKLVQPGTKYKLFDTRFKLSCEDVDLCHSALMLDMSLVPTQGLQPDWLVHLGHQTINAVGQTDKKILDRMHEARRELCRKWGYEERIED